MSKLLEKHLYTNKYIRMYRVELNILASLKGEYFLLLHSSNQVHGCFFCFYIRKANAQELKATFH